MCIRDRFVDEAGVVLAGGDYFVDVDGDGIFNHTEVLEWVPEGLSLIHIYCRMSWKKSIESCLAI